MNLKWFLRHRYLFLSTLLLLLIVGVVSFSTFLTGNYFLFEGKLSSLVTGAIRAVIYISIFVMLQRRIPDRDGKPFYRHPLKIRFFLALIFFEVVIVHNAAMLTLEKVL